jgi:thioredoxin 1
MKIWKHTLLVAAICAAAITLVSARQTTTTPAAGAVAKQAGPYNEQADARKDIAAALALAKADKKNVILDFGGNWCPDCLVLAKLFEDPAVAPFREANFHVVSIDVGRFTKNLDIDKEYGGVIAKGVPAVVILDPSGQMIDSTKDGSFESARKFTPEQLMGYLKKWVPKPF